MKFYKYRAFLLILLVKIISKVLFVEMIPIPSVSAMIRREGKLLFVNLTYLNGLGIVGGVIQSGEDVEQALVREVREETGLEVTNKKFLFSAASSFRSMATLSFFFEVEVSGTEQSSREGGLVWLEPQETLDKLAYPNIRPSLEKYIKNYFR